MDAKMKDLLVQSFGLVPHANDGEAMALLRELSNEQREMLMSVYVDGAGPSSGGSRTAAMSDGTRVAKINNICMALLKEHPTHGASLQQAALNAIASGDGVENFRRQALAMLARTHGPIGVSVDSVTVGEDRAIASLRDAIPQAICLRAGIEPDRLEKFEQREAKERRTPGRAYLGHVHERAHQLRHRPMLEQYRMLLAQLGAHESEYMAPARLANCFTRRGLQEVFPNVAMLVQSSSDFSSLMLEAVNKSMRLMYLDAPRSWPLWAQKQENDDFKNINRVVLSESPDLIASPEGSEIKYVALTDSKETYHLAEYKNGIKLTRRALINDDLNAFNQIPRLQANSAARKEDDVAYAVLTANAAMADTVALFHASHANLAGSGTAISIASLQAAVTAMGKQKGLAGAARLELQPKFLLVPTSIAEYTKQLIGSDTLIASGMGASAAQVGARNPFYGRFQVIGSSRLDDNSQTAWYLMSDYRDGQINTVEVCFLNGESEPVVQQETDFDTGDLKFAIRHTVAAKAIDHRGLYKNAG